MAYEIFTKMTRMSTDPKMSIGKKLGRLQFNSSAAKVLSERTVDYVLLMWDKENRTIAVRGIGKKDSRAYSLRFAKKGNGAGFAARAFLHHIGYDLSETRSFECHWNDEQNMFEIPISADAFKATETPIRGAKLPIKGVRFDTESKGQSGASA